MPTHDWTRVDVGIFHAFHHGWITKLARALNRGVLPSDYYAIPELHTAGSGQDEARFVAETQAEFYRRKKSSIAVRHTSGDRLVAIIEIVSPGNKSSRHA